MKKDFSIALAVLLLLTAVAYVRAPQVLASEDDQTEMEVESNTQRKSLIQTKFLQLKENFLQKKTQRQENFEERKEKRIENQEQRKEERQEKQESRQEERQEKRAEKMDEAADRIEKRFAMHEQKLSNWLERAEKHVSDLKAKGKDTAATEKSIAKAKTTLTEAVTLGKASVAQVRAIEATDWQTQKPAMQAARESVKKAQAAFVTALKEIRQVLVELKKITI